MPETDLALLEDAARAAGEIALRHFGRLGDVREKPDGGGPVTAADLEVDDMLRQRLRAARPDYGWLSEETPDTPERLAARRVFIVDPIDGTRAFVAGENCWGHALAIAEGGRVVAAVMYLPVLDRTYAAQAGQGALCNGSALQVTGRRELSGADILISRNQLDPGFWPGGVPNLVRHFRSVMIYRLCLVAEGRFDATITFRDAGEWDVAAGDLIAREAGAILTDKTGATLRFNSPDGKVRGLIAAGPALHAKILERL